MILPIVSYGSSVLKKTAKEITSDYPNLSELIANMWETMYAANGVGLAAPQIGLSIRIFGIEEIEILNTFKKVFINPKIIREEGKLWDFNEGCLSIPEVREDISRKEEILINFFDENFELQKLKLNGLAARVVQHEYDHVEGVLFTDHLSSLKKRLIKNRLSLISKGDITVDYKMSFPKKSRK
jgi:peptide deformylase